MKNSFKLGFLALAIAVSTSACGSKSSSVSTDSTTTTVDSTKVVVDTVKKDTTVAAAVDTTKK